MGKKGINFFHFHSVETKQHIFMNADIRCICCAIFQTQMSNTSSERNYSPLPLSKRRHRKSSKTTHMKRATMRKMVMTKISALCEYCTMCLPDLVIHNV